MFKKVITALLALSTAASLAVISASAEYTKGDVDNSGKVDIEDVANLMNHINGVKSLSDEGLAAADLNSDSSVDIEDVVNMLNTINGVSASAVNKYENDIFYFTAGSDWEVTEDGGAYLLEYIGTDVPEATDLAAIYFNAQVIPKLDSYSIQQIGELYMDGTGLKDSLTDYDVEISTFNGAEAYIVKSKYNNDMIISDLRVIVARSGDTIFVVATLTYEGITDSIMPTAEKVISTFNLK